MFKRILAPVLALLMLLPACAAQPSAPTATGLQATQRPVKPTVSATGTKTPGCSVATIKPTIGPTEQSLFPLSKQGDQVLGPDTASVTIIEYSDFQ